MAHGKAALIGAAGVGAAYAAVRAIKNPALAQGNARMLVRDYDGAIAVFEAGITAGMERGLGAEELLRLHMALGGCYMTRYRKSAADSHYARWKDLQAAKGSFLRARHYNNGLSPHDGPIPPIRQRYRVTTAEQVERIDDLIVMTTQQLEVAAEAAAGGDGQVLAAHNFAHAEEVARADAAAVARGPGGTPELVPVEIDLDAEALLPTGLKF